MAAREFFEAVKNAIDELPRGGSAQWTQYRQGLETHILELLQGTRDPGAKFQGVICSGIISNLPAEIFSSDYHKIITNRLSQSSKKKIKCTKFFLPKIQIFFNQKSKILPKSKFLLKPENFTKAQHFDKKLKL